MRSCARTPNANSPFQAPSALGLQMPIGIHWPSRVGKLSDESGSRAQRSAHLIEKLEDLSVGLERATLSIGYRTLLAERSDDGLSLLQFVPWHAGEQMVFDLVVKSAVPEV